MKNKNHLLVIFIILLIFIIFALGSYLVYDKFLIKNTNKTSFNYTLEKRTTAQAIQEESIEVLVDTNGDTFLYTIQNSDSKKGLKSLEKQFKVYSPKGYESLGNTEFKAIKLNISNVLTAYHVHYGNGGFTYFIFVTEQGKLAYLNCDKVINDGEINLKEINEIQNVVSVVDNTYTMTPYAIDINGNEISLFNYIR